MEPWQELGLGGVVAIVGLGIGLWPILTEGHSVEFSWLHLSLMVGAAAVHGVGVWMVIERPLSHRSQ